MKSHVLSRKSAVTAAAIVAIGGALFATQSLFAAVTNVLAPDGEGYSLQWTPSVGTTHYTLVDEAVCNGTTDYVRTSTTGQRDAFTVSLAGVPDGATLTAVEIKPCASRNSGGGGSSVMNVFYRLNGVNSSDAGAYGVTGTTPADLATTTITIASTTKQSGSTLQVGAVYSSGTRGVRLSRITARVTYTALAAPTSLTATPGSTSTTLINLAWTDNAVNESGYKIERGLSTSSFAEIAVVGTSTTVYADTTVSAGTTYYYRVRAYNAGADTTYSNTANATTGSIPADPSALGATPSASLTSRITLNWTDNASNETSFLIERSLTPGSGFVQVGSSSANVTSYDDNGLSAGTTYYYRVRAANTYGNSAYTSEVSATTGTVPAAPSALSATPSSSLTSRITLSWTDNSSNETNFFVERSTVSGSGFVQVATATANTVTIDDNGLAAGTTYYYRMRAANAYGSSAYTSEASATTGSTPTAPSSLAGTPDSSVMQINLTWTDNAANETAYTVERKLSTDATYTQIASTSANVTSYSDSGVTTGLTYNYRVRGFNDYGFGSFSNVATVTAPAAPSAPGSLFAIATSTNSVAVIVGYIGNASYYTIERSFGTSTGYAFLATTTSTVYRDETPGSGTWYYRATASNNFGTSGYSPEDFETIP